MHTIVTMGFFYAIVSVLGFVGLRDYRIEGVR